MDTPIVALTLVVLLFSKSVPVFGTIDILPISYNDVNRLEFSLNLEFLAAEFFLYGSLGYGLDRVDLQLAKGGPPPIGATRANLDNLTADIITQFGYQQVGNIRAIANTVRGFPRPLLNITSYAMPSTALASYVEANPNLSRSTFKALVAGLLGVKAGQDGVIRALLYQRRDTRVEPYNITVGEFTNRISELRNTLGRGGVKEKGLINVTTSLGVGGIRVSTGNVLSANIDSLSYGRTPAEILRIVYGTGNERRPGAFFPNGANGQPLLASAMSTPQDNQPASAAIDSSSTDTSPEATPAASSSSPRAHSSAANFDSPSSVSVVLLFSKSVPVFGTIDILPISYNDVNRLEFSLNLEFLAAEFFLYGSLGYGLDRVDPQLAKGGPPPIGATRANLDNLTADIITQFGYQQVGNIRAIANTVRGFPRPLLNITSYAMPSTALASYVEANPNLSRSTFKAGVKAGQDGVIRALLYQRRDTRVEPYNITVGEFTNRISELRNTLGRGGVKEEGLINVKTSLGVGGIRVSTGNVLSANIDSLSYGRTPAEILRIVYGTGNERRPGAFFPNGANGHLLIELTQVKQVLTKLSCHLVSVTSISSGENFEESIPPSTYEGNNTDEVASKYRESIMDTPIVALTLVVLLFSKSVPVFGTIDILPISYNDVNRLEFSLNLEFLAAEFFLYGSLGYGLDRVDPQLAKGGPPPIGATRANLDNLTADIITQFGYQQVGNIRAIANTVRGFPRPLLDISSAVFARTIDIAFGRDIRPPFNPYGNSINFLIASYYMPYTALTGYVEANPNLSASTFKALVAGLLGVKAGQDGVIRALLYQRRDTRVEPYNITVGEFTNRISELRNTLGRGGVKEEGLINVTTSLGVGGIRVSTGNVLSANIDSLSYGRTPAEILRIVYGTGNERRPGAFFPNGANGHRVIIAPLRKRLESLISRKPTIVELQASLATNCMMLKDLLIELTQVKQVLTKLSSHLAVVLLFSKSVPVFGTIDILPISYNDVNRLEFSLNLEFLAAEFFLYGSLGYGLDRVDPQLAKGGPPPIGATRANLDNLTADIITQFGYQQVGNIRAIANTVRGFPRPLLDISSTVFARTIDIAFGRDIRPPFNPYGNSINFLIASYYMPYTALTGYVEANPNLSGSTFKAVRLLGVKAGQDGVIRALLYQLRDTRVEPYNITVGEFTNRISELRNTLGRGGVKEEGLINVTTSLGVGGIRVSTGNVLSANIDSLSYGRTPAEILRIVYGTGNERRPGAFFPNGANGRVGEIRVSTGNVLSANINSLSYGRTPAEILRIVYGTGNERRPGAFFPNGANGRIATILSA
ncbi:hypothetical protein G4B88_007430 [Cannabis sativa]|uniref:Uncharacterized protein n=1 Tax=Cannabis sativa TaxID=3483 RepID=A0A7J6E7M5_CANSA|nr:hypothetical protein G4B88_007430 [Cannabis sativa]